MDDVFYLLCKERKCIILRTKWKGRDCDLWKGRHRQANKSKLNKALDG